MSTVTVSKGPPWTKRTARAAWLAEQRPWAAELLLFYLRILEFQKSVFDRAPAPSPTTDTHSPDLRQSLDLAAAATFLPALLKTVRQYAPEKLRQEAEKFSHLSPEQVQAVLRAALIPASAEDPAAFFPRAVLQPMAERIASSGPAEHPTVAGNKCPRCQGEPQLAILRPEGDGGKRWLLCSLCQTEWEFYRVLCPNCGERDHAKLPRFAGEGNGSVRVEACDSCRAYLKSFDLTVDGLIIPLVDEIATAPLDIWAAEKDYRKMRLNLLGF